MERENQAISASYLSYLSYPSSLPLERNHIWDPRRKKRQSFTVVGCEVCVPLLVLSSVCWGHERGLLESINNFGRKYSFSHKIQFRALAYQNTPRPWNVLNIFKWQGLCETTVGNIFSQQLNQNPIHQQ